MDLTSLSSTIGTATMKPTALQFHESSLSLNPKKLRGDISSDKFPS